MIALEQQADSGCWRSLRGPFVERLLSDDGRVPARGRGATDERQGGATGQKGSLRQRMGRTHEVSIADRLVPGQGRIRNAAVCGRPGGEATFVWVRSQSGIACQKYATIGTNLGL